MRYTNSTSTPKESPEPLPFLSPIIRMSAPMCNGVLVGSMLRSFGSGWNAQPLRVELGVPHETLSIRTMLRKMKKVVAPLGKFIVLNSEGNCKFIDRRVYPLCLPRFCSHLKVNSLYYIQGSLEVFIGSKVSSKCSDTLPEPLEHFKATIDPVNTSSTRRPLNNHGRGPRGASDWLARPLFVKWFKWIPKQYSSARSRSHFFLSPFSTSCAIATASEVYSPLWSPPNQVMFWLIKMPLEAGETWLHV